jgi:hypothetical protein
MLDWYSMKLMYANIIHRLLYDKLVFAYIKFILAIARPCSYINEEYIESGRTVM